MKRKNYSVALSSSLNEEALGHLIRTDGQEDLCFGLWYPSQGKTRTTALVARLILPRRGERLVHGNASFLPNYFERALGEAAQASAGLAFFHSHPCPGWQHMSDDDVKAERNHAGAVKAATGLPLVGLTVGNDGAWSARFWEKVAARTYERRWCSNVRVVGEKLSVTYAEALMPRPRLKEELRRTISSWGEQAQADLARMRFGIVGAGSVGSIVGEALARIGIKHIKLIDFDRVDFVNLDRLLHATYFDAVMHRSKVSSLGRALRRSATADGFTVDEVDRSIAEEDGFCEALDCDVLFCCVDRPWGRHVLNFIAYAHLIPVIDGGIQVKITKQRKLRAADWKAHIASPQRRCLDCLGQYNSGLVAAEREGYFDDPHYVEDLPDDHPIRRNENVFVFSLSAASFELMQALMMIVAPLGICDAGQQMYHFVPGLFDNPRFERCDERCPFPELLAKGDRTGLIVTGRHRHAENIRAIRQRASRRVRLRYRFVYYLQRFIEKYLHRAF